MLYEERRMGKKLVVACTVLVCALMGRAASADAATPMMYKKEGKTLSCSLTITGDRKQYLISSSNLTAMKLMKIVRCLGKATRQRPLPVKDDEVIIRAGIFANVDGMRCYKGKRFFLKFKGDIPGNLEKLVDACFLRAAHEYRERMESKHWT